MNESQKLAAAAAIYGFPIRGRRSIGSLRAQGVITGGPNAYELQSPYAVGIVDGKPWVGECFEPRRD